MCLSFSAHSQNADLFFKNITINEGLSQNSVIDIVQDNQGFMWFATQEGLNRYDGSEFKIFPKSYDDITNPDNSRLGKLLINGDDLWMITKGGKLEILNLATEKFSHKKHFYKDVDIIPPISYIFIENDNKIWIGTENDGVFLTNKNLQINKHFFKDSELNNNILSNKINKIYKDSVGKIWILTKDGIYLVFNGNIKAYLEGVNSNAMVEDAAGNLWLGTLGQGIYSKQKHEDHFLPFRSLKSGLLVPADLVVESLFIDENLRMWVGTYGNGLYIIENKFDLVRQILPVRTNPNSIGFQDILSIYQDDKGGIWIGTDGGGISFYDESFENFKILNIHNVPEKVPVEQIRAITTDNEGFLWFGTSGNGFTRYDPRKNEFIPFHLKPYKNGINNYDRIIALHADNSGNMWIGTHGNGTLLKDRKSGEIKKWFTADATQVEERLPDNNIWCFLEEDDDKVWAGSRYSGLLLIDQERGFIEKYRENESDEDNIRAIVRVNDSILALGYEKKGIKLFNTKKHIFYPVAKDFIKTHLDQVEIKTLYYNNGWLWAGTSGEGLLVMHLQSGSSKIFTEKDGLPNNMIYSILPENSNTIWASTNKGLFQLAYRIEEEALSILKIKLFTKENGLQSNEFNTGAFHKGNDGIIYFGGINGINFFNPKQISAIQKKYKVIISQAIVENMPLQGEKIINYTDHLDLSYNQNSIAFHYTALNYVSLGKLAYAYMLEGYDEDWINAGSRQYTAYTNLNSGDYIFKVRLKDDLLVDSQITALAISIATPFWLSLWFRILLVLSVLGILYSIYKIRVNQLMELQRVKDTISAELHDDLGSRLTTIHLLSAIFQPQLEKNSKANVVLQKIDKEIHASSEALNEIVWNIKITDENLIDMIANIRRHVSEVLEACNISYTIQTPDKLGLYKMKMHKRRELFLICKELINNVRKHANAKNVEMKIRREKSMLYVSVKDDGIGFCPQDKTHRNGLENLKNRIEKWRGKLNISSKIGEGSLLEFWIPFDNNNFFKRYFAKIYKEI